MKIVFVIDSWNGGNGSVVATKRVVRELINRGHKVAVVSTKADSLEDDYEFYEVPGFYLPFVRESLEKMNFLFAWGKKSVLRRAYRGADLVQVQLPFFAARTAVRVAREMGVTVTGACHVQPQNIISAMGKEDPKMETMFHALFNFCLFKQVDAIHCPSRFAANLIAEKGSRAHLRVISNGIPREYEPMEMERPEWFGDRFVILNVGRHALEKRQELLIEGVLRSKYRDNIQLLLCGKGENSEKLKKRGEELPVKPLIDFVTHEDKLRYLNTSDLYLHSSVVELESLSCLEAIGCGLPCLIGDSPHSAASQFALEERLTFTMDDPDSLARRIDYWYEHRAELRNMKQSVLDMAEYYRMDRSTTSMEEFFADALAGRVAAAEIESAVGHEPRPWWTGMTEEDLIPELTRSEC
ncbi:MAG: glycosyltransferase [Spirochaetes bacterium]|nr:glycosyltransferase [Spirochaetota bacterium]